MASIDTQNARFIVTYANQGEEKLVVDAKH